MKRLFQYVLSLSLVLVAMFSLVGCENNKPGETPSEVPAQLVFSEEFGYDSSTTYTTGNSAITIESLSEYADYKSVTLYAKKETAFNHLSFKIKSKSEDYENLYIGISTPAGSWISEKLIITSNEITINIFYVKWSSGSHEFLTQKENSGNNSFTLDKVKFSQDDKITISFGVKSEALNWKDYYATGKYVNPISIFGFNIE